MKELISLLDKKLRGESLRVNKDISNYALPPETSCDEYEEVYREYGIFGRRTFTVLVRKNAEGVYWIRCGYKERDSKTVEGLGERDLTSSDITECVKHAVEHFNKVLRFKGW